MSWSFNKKAAIGAAAVTGAATLLYAVTRPTKTKKKKKKSTNDIDMKDTFVFTIKKLPSDLHLTMPDFDGFNAHVAGDRKNAVKYGSRLLKINKELVEGLSYEEILGKFMRAKPPIKLLFREIKELNTKWSKAQKLKAEGSEMYAAKNIKGGISKLSAAIDLHPTNKVYYSNRILMYLKTEQYDRALDDCHKIRQLDPKSLYIKGHHLRGLVLVKLQKFKHAASAFQTVLKIMPENKQAEERLQDCIKQLEQQQEKDNIKRKSQQQELKESLKGFQINNEEGEESEPGKQKILKDNNQDDKKIPNNINEVNGDNQVIPKDNMQILDQSQNKIIPKDNNKDEGENKVIKKVEIEEKKVDPKDDIQVPDKSQNKSKDEEKAQKVEKEENMVAPKDAKKVPDKSQNKSKDLEKVEKEENKVAPKNHKKVPEKSQNKSKDEEKAQKVEKIENNEQQKKNTVEDKSQVQINNNDKQNNEIIEEKKVNENIKEPEKDSDNKNVDEQKEKDNQANK